MVVMVGAVCNVTSTAGENRKLVNGNAKSYNNSQKCYIFTILAGIRVHLSVHGKVPETDAPAQRTHGT